MSYGRRQSRLCHEIPIPPKQTAESPQVLSEVEPDALAALRPKLYEELRRLAAEYRSVDQRGHTAQPADLVHQAYFQLLRHGETVWQSRAHVLGFGAQVMRQILVGRAIASARLKGEGSESIRLTL